MLLKSRIHTELCPMEQLKAWLLIVPNSQGSFGKITYSSLPKFKEMDILWHKMVVKTEFLKKKKKDCSLPVGLSLVSF